MAKHKTPEAHECHCASHFWAPLTHGRVTIVDPIDAHFLQRFSWHAKTDNRLTAYACSDRAERLYGTRYLHKLILRPARGLVTDHKDGNGCNNSRSNLLGCKHKQNMRRRRASRNSTSKFVGVSWVSPIAKWQAQIMLDGRNFNLGRFKDEEAAARAYDAAARKYFGAFARPNFQEAVS